MTTSQTSEVPTISYDHGARVVVTAGPHVGRTGTVRRNLATSCAVSVLLDGTDCVERFRYRDLRPVDLAAAPASEAAALPPPEAPPGSAAFDPYGPVHVADLLQALRACHELYERACREGVL